MSLRTVGHGTLPEEDFAALVSDAGIGVVVDVRSFPASRRHPQFRREAMERWLPDAGVAYQWEPRLGGRRRPRPDSPHGALRVPAFRGYADHMETDEFRDAVDELLAEAGTRPAAVMCAESVWWRCHRRLIADRLTVDGWTVTHLLAPGKSERHVLWDAARTLDGHLVYDAGTLPLPT